MSLCRRRRQTDSSKPENLYLSLGQM
jgi:hypothetical protein